MPLISNGTIKILSSSGKVLATLSSKQSSLINKFFQDYAAAGFGSAATFVGAVQRAARNNTTAIVLQRNVVFDAANVERMAGGWRFINGKKIYYHGAPLAKNARTGALEGVQLHHIDQIPEQNGVVAEILASENKSGNALRPAPQGVKHDEEWTQFFVSYWKDRLQDAINQGLVPSSVLANKDVRAKLDAGGFVYPK